MAENFQNFYVTRLREACDASATTIYVDTIPTITEGTLVIEYTNSTKREIIHFTGRSGYSLTGCTRGYEGTTAQSHSAGVDVRQNVTAGMMDAITNRAIHTENIADEAVTTAKIDDEAITTEKIEDEAVTSDKIDFTTITYSEDEENPIGTWIDGSIIYRKVVQYTSGSDIGSWNTVISGVSHVLSVLGFYVSGADSNEVHILPKSYLVWFRVNNTNNQLQEAHRAADENSRPMTLIIEYTKV